MNIGKALYYILSTNTAVKGLVSAKIYPAETPQAVEMPVILYSISSINPTTSKDGVSDLDIYTVDISAFSNKYDEAVDIYQAIRDVLDRYRGTASTIEIDQINFKGLTIDRIESAQVYQSSSTYEIRVKV